LTTVKNQHPQAKQLAELERGQQPSSWTQKVTGVFQKKDQPIGPSRPNTKVIDPIALGFASGPPNAGLYLSMAKMSDQGGNTEHARSMYHRALSIQPNHLDGMLALARLEDREGQLDAALHYYQQAVQNHPQSAKALNDLSLCYARRGQVREALAPLQQAVQAAPEKALYRNNLAKVLIEMNDLNGAMQQLTAVHPPAVAQYNMGYLLHERNRDQEAAQYLAAAAQTDPNLGAAGTLLAEVTGRTQQVAQLAPGQRAPASNDHILPTPQTSPGQPYPSTGVVSSVSPSFQTVPAETAQVPVDRSPTLLPPVR